MSRSQKILGQVYSILDTLEGPNRREFFGAATKCLIPVSAQDDESPATGYEELSSELRSFQKGFSDLTARTLKSPTDNLKLIVKSLWDISEARARGKGRPRDVSKKLGKLRRRARKVLQRLQTPKPLRGVNVFFESIHESYFIRKRNRKQSPISSKSSLDHNGRD
jgi:hypothetical protein